MTDNEHPLFKEVLDKITDVSDRVTLIEEALKEPDDDMQISEELARLSDQLMGHQQIVNKSLDVSTAKMDAIERNHVEFSKFVEDVLFQLKGLNTDHTKIREVLEGLHDWLQTGRHIVR